MKAEIAGRPLLAASLGLIAGISSKGDLLNLLFLILIVVSCWPKKASLIGVSLAFLVGFLIAPSGKRSLQLSGSWQATGQVVSAPSLSGSAETFLLQTERGVFLVIARERRDIALGQTVSVSGELSHPSEASTKRLETEGVSGEVVAQPSGLEIVGSGLAWFEVSNRWREAFVSSTREALPAEEASVVNALCFADAGVSNSIRQELSRTGAAHILSVSGMQVFLVALLLQLLLSSFGLPRNSQIWIIGLVLAFYATASGLHASTLRATIISILALAAFRFKREPDALSALGLAAILTLIWQPWTVYSPGFQLSYVAVASLTLYWKPFRETGDRKLVSRIGLWLRQTFRLSLVLTLALAPLTAFHFGVVSLVSPFTNLLLAPVLPVIVLVSMVGWPLGFISPFIRIGLLRMIAGPLATWVLWITSSFGGQSWTSINWPEFNAYWLVLYYGFFLLTWYRRDAIRR